MLFTTLLPRLVSLQIALLQKFHSIFFDQEEFQLQRCRGDSWPLPSSVEFSESWNPGAKHSKLNQSNDELNEKWFCSQAILGTSTCCQTVTAFVHSIFCIVFVMCGEKSSTIPHTTLVNMLLRSQQKTYLQKLCNHWLWEDLWLWFQFIE